MVLVTKHSWWRGSYERGLLLSPTGVRTVDPADGRVTNEWPWSSLRGVAETEKAGRSAFVLTFEQEPGKCFFWPAAKKAALTFSSSDAPARAGLLGVLRKAIQQESLLATVRHTLTMHRRLSDQAAAVAAAAEEEHGSSAHAAVHAARLTRSLSRSFREESGMLSRCATAGNLLARQYSSMGDIPESDSVRANTDSAGMSDGAANSAAELDYARRVLQAEAAAVLDEAERDAAAAEAVALARSPSPAAPAALAAPSALAAPTAGAERPADASQPTAAARSRDPRQTAVLLQQLHWQIEDLRAVQEHVLWQARGEYMAPT